MSSERQENSRLSPWWGEHIHRYHEALKLLPKTNARVLDIACGNGFGSNFLAENGYSVIGADLSEEAIEFCRNKYSSSGASFEICDGTKLPYNSESFDAVISFETIEHTTKYNEMLLEFKRVLKKDGIVIISTPNICVNSPSGIIVNPYHTQEWNYEELESMVKSCFDNVKIFGQQYVRYKAKNGARHVIGKFIENLLYKRGIRKIPISIQDKIMQLIIKEPIYPTILNYQLVDNLSEIVNCKTFFVVGSK